MPVKQSSPTRPQRPPVTRYGPVHGAPSKFLTEERFAWQKSKFQSDVLYELPSVSMTRSVVFSSGLRSGMDDNPDAKKRSTGPGSYNPGKCYDFCSDYMVHHAARLGAAPRESMAMKTPSPGPVYNVDKLYYNGSFNIGLRAFFILVIVTSILTLTILLLLESCYPRTRQR